MDEEILELIKLADGCNKCNDCPFFGETSYTTTYCRLLRLDPHEIYTEGIFIYYHPECDLEVIKRKNINLTPEKIDAQKLINLYIKTNL